MASVPCTTEHEYEVFYIGAMGDGSYPTDEAFETYMTQNCNPAFDAYIGKAYDDSGLDIFYLTPTDDSCSRGRGAQEPGVDNVFSRCDPLQAKIKKATGKTPGRRIRQSRTSRVPRQTSPRVGFGPWAIGSRSPSSSSGSSYLACRPS
jgi:Septum formation